MRVLAWLLSSRAVSFCGELANIVTDIIEPEEQFAIDQYEDLASTQKPTLTIRQSDVKFVHALVSKELETMVHHSHDDSHV